jgi:hypothetical protein
MGLETHSPSQEPKKPISEMSKADLRARREEQIKKNGTGQIVNIGTKGEIIKEQTAQANKEGKVIIQDKADLAQLATSVSQEPQEPPKPKTKQSPQPIGARRSTTQEINKVINKKPTIDEKVTITDNQTKIETTQGKDYSDGQRKQIGHFDSKYFDQKRDIYHDRLQQSNITRDDQILPTHKIIQYCSQHIRYNKTANTLTSDEPDSKLSRALIDPKSDLNQKLYGMWKDIFPEMNPYRHDIMDAHASTQTVENLSNILRNRNTYYSGSVKILQLTPAQQKAYREKIQQKESLPPV